jgi:ankyrin repeat protein
MRTPIDFWAANVDAGTLICALRIQWLARRRRTLGRHAYAELRDLVSTRDENQWQSILRYTDPWGRNMLHFIAEYGATIALTDALEAGVPIDSTDHLGNTALHWAAHGGHRHLVEDLIRMGARTDLKNKAGKTARCVAVDRLKWMFPPPVKLSSLTANLDRGLRLNPAGI